MVLHVLIVSHNVSQSLKGLKVPYKVYQYLKLYHSVTHGPKGSQYVAECLTVSHMVSEGLKLSHSD